MRTILEPSTLGACLSFLLLCSCTTTQEPSAIIPASDLPTDVTIDSDAGRGSWLLVTIQLEGGAELPFIVDTGSSWTVFDKSLEPKLGKRLGTMTVPSLGVKMKLGRYAAPKLYLGNTRLMTGNNIYTTDRLKEESGFLHRPIMGILGMDCLKHYCIQIDFEAGKMRFLDPDHADVAKFGKAFPVAFKQLPFIHHTRLIEGGETNWWLIDTGCNIDGLLSTPLFRASGGDSQAIGWFPRCVWDGNIYTNLVIGTGVDLIGLRFLARHLVTLNFPERTMYLKQSSIGPLAGDSLVQKFSGATRTPSEFLESLMAEGQLPGLSKDGNGQLFCIYHPQGNSNCYAFVFRENGDSSACHYRVARTSKDSPWKLQKAWRTDQDAHTIEEYPVP